MDLIFNYFPNLTENQKSRFLSLQPLYAEWNGRINVISRQDLDKLEERHILHAISLNKMVTFNPGARILDLGTGGGFPGIPLSILYPEVEFVLADSIGKKIGVVQAIAETLHLNNVTAVHSRAEDLKMNGNFDFVVSRAVAPLDKLMRWSQKLMCKKHRHAYPNGLLALKGGSMEGEIKALPGNGFEYTELFPLRAVFTEPFFDEKLIVYVQG